MQHISVRVKIVYQQWILYVKADIFLYVSHVWSVYYLLIICWSKKFFKEKLQTKMKHTLLYPGMKSECKITDKTNLMMTSDQVTIFYHCCRYVLVIL